MKAFSLVIVLICYVPAIVSSQENSNDLNILSVEIQGVSNEVFGRELMILREMFSCMGKTYKMTKVPYGRHLYTFVKENFDVVTTVPASVTLKGYNSQSHMEYTNGASTFSSIGREISSVDDLKGLRVVSFVGASEQIKGLKGIIPDLTFYSEVASQEAHSRMLFLGRVDAVISDGVIFHYYNELLRSKFPQDERFRSDVQFHAIFEPTPFKLYFKTQDMQLEFDMCLEGARKVNRLNQLNYQYMMNTILRAGSSK